MRPRVRILDFKERINFCRLQKQIIEIRKIACMIDEIEEIMEGNFGSLIKRHSDVGKEEEEINEKNKIAYMKEMVQNGMKDLMNRVSILTELIKNKNRISEFSLEETREGSELS